MLAAGRERRIDVAEAGGRVYVGHPQRRLRLRRQRDRQLRTRLPLGTLVYVYGALRALAALEARALGASPSTATAHAFDGYAVAVANSGVFGGGMWLVPDAELDDGLLDVVLTDATSPKRALPARPAARCSRARTSDEPGFALLRGREITFHADRPFTAYADGDPIADLPATVRVVPGALRVIAP